MKSYIACELVSRQLETKGMIGAQTVTLTFRRRVRMGTSIRVPLQH